MIENKSIKQRLAELELSLDLALQADGEHGAHWLNNAKAEEWARDNPELLKWIKEFREFIQSVS